MAYAASTTMKTQAGALRNLWRGIIRESALPLRAGLEAGRSSSKERTILSNAERSPGRGSLHEPDPHLPVMRCQLVRLSERTAAACAGTGEPTGGMDALELPPHAAADGCPLSCWGKPRSCGMMMPLARNHRLRQVGARPQNDGKTGGLQIAEPPSVLAGAETTEGPPGLPMKGFV